MEGLHFTEDDIREQLEALGYQNVPPTRLKEFARDLEKLVEHEQSYRNTSSSTTDTDGFIDPSTSRKPLESNSSTHGYYQNPSTEYHSQYGKENETSLLQPSDEAAPMAVRPKVRPKSILKDPPKRPAVVRKVLRKRNGQAEVFHESISEGDTGEMSAINERLAQLPLSDQVNDSDFYAKSETDTSSIIHDVLPRRPYSSRDLYSHRPAGDEVGVYKPHLPRSFIRPSSVQGNFKRHSRKTDPVTRHKMYQSEWHSFKAPGEKNRKDLRWNIRERMMYKDNPILQKNQPRVYVPNSYQVPTDKKRQALRWAVRTDLAHRQMPQSSAFQF
ncbi:hydrolethalus syndrome protein 1 homolog [Anneissia japonica]|uniref:hydrolethalus syndrome protein 1 homolog n=1 Tax=Anneissia japonica TaxID=1529436 RepID=UPI001425A439|nr:hydrolethalus syndrome protein 1 homolog [Anneissia japonica]XP_033105447.1 hydrolethalus syndrome protein 1 homolog [Anneissia japonica]XP_033105448.1 hydrolethalus syndrome protein 1 homolog [Anneissia japonica]